jgi:hypothetical protein
MGRGSVEGDKDGGICICWSPGFSRFLRNALMGPGTEPTPETVPSESTTPTKESYEKRKHAESLTFTKRQTAG